MFTNTNRANRTNTETIAIIIEPIIAFIPAFAFEPAEFAEPINIS